MLNAKNIGQGTVKLDSVEYVSQDVCERLSQYVIKYGDILNEGTYKVLTESYKTGLLRAIGVSNFNAGQIDRYTHTKL